MKYILSILCCVIVINTYSQGNFQKINRDSVKLLVSDSTSKTYYPNLLNRFNQFDATLTPEEYKLLYYGFVFQEGYSAYADTKGEEIENALNEKDYSKTILIIDSVLDITPVSLRANYQKALALYMFDSTSLAFQKYVKRFSNLVKAILSSGDGLTCSTAFKAISVADEYDIIYKHFSIEKIYGQGLEYPCDKMKIEPNEFFKESAMYFDISEAFIQMKGLFSEPEKSKKESD